MKKSRMRFSILNSTITTSAQICNIILRFMIQTAFIHTLGATYLGINGLFTNILGILSFADLGIGAAITFSLYKPLSEEDYKHINSIMAFFRKTYHLIGIAIGAMGLLLLPFLHFLIKGHDIPNLEFMFLLFLLNTVISYFFSYNQTLLIADQQGYKCSLIQLLFLIIKSIFQIISLIIFHSFLLYLIVQILATLFTNIVISRIVSKQYPKLVVHKAAPLSANVFNKIKGNTLGMIGSKVGEVSLSASDNIIMSSFIGLHIVGLYSNYVLIINSISMMLMQLVGSVSASIGNFAVSSKSKQEQYQLMKRHLFVNSAVTIAFSSCLIGLLNPFIILWIGKAYTLSPVLIILMVINFLVIAIRQTPVTFIASYGLFRKIGIKSVIEACTNVGLSLWFVVGYNMGVEGVLLGTLSSNLLINLFYEPFVVIKYGFNYNKYIDFMKIYVLNIVINIFTVLLIQSLTSYINYTGFLGLGINLLISLLISGVVFVIFYYRSSEFKFFLNLIVNYLNRK